MPKAAPKAKLVKGKIEIRADVNTIVLRDVRDSDKKDFPDLFKAKPKGRPKKVTSDDAE